MIEEILAAAIGTTAFALLFGVPKKAYPYCAIIGCSGWIVYKSIAYLTGYDPLACFTATVVIVLLSRLLAVWRKYPATVFYITGIFPLVPGGGIYWTAYYLVIGETRRAASYGFSALKTCIAIVLGVVMVFEIPNRVFHKLARS